MVRQVIAFFLRQRQWVLLGVAALMLGGAFAISRLPIDALPDITNVQVMINASTGALSPEEIEATVTRPIESEVSGLPKVEEIRSLSKYSLSQVTVIFHDGMEPYFARQLVAERLQNLSSSLPQGVTLSMGPLATGLGEVMQYAVRAKPGSPLSRLPDTERLIRLRTLQDYTIRPELKTVPGVEEVDSIGGLKRVIYVDADPYRMSYYGVDLGRVAKSVQNVGLNIGGGFIESPEHRNIFRGRGRVASLAEIGRFPLRLFALGPAIQLRDVATIHEGGEPRNGAAVYQGEETVIATVMVRLGENSRSVAIAALEKLGQIQLPGDVEVVPLYSQSYLVNTTIRTVAENLLVGAALVILVLLIMLRNLRAALIVALAIPLSMLFAAIGMDALGVSANLMSLGAVDFGLIVDGSVVMLENIVRRFEEEQPGTPAERLQLVGEAAGEVAAPTIAGVLTILIVYVPIIGLGGIEGKLFSPMAATVVMALAGSLLIALIVVPGLAAMLLCPKAHNPEGSRIRRAYGKVLGLSLHFRLVPILVAVAVGVLALFAFRKLGQDFLPQLDEGDAVIAMTRPSDISLPALIALQKRVDAAIIKFPEVERVFTKIGSAESNVDPNGLNLSDTLLILKKDRSQWPKQSNGRIRTKEELIAAVCVGIKKSGQSEECTAEEPIGGRFNDLLEGSRADVALRIFGPDLSALADLTEKAKVILEKIQGVDEVQQNHLMTPRPGTVFEFRPDLERLDNADMRVSDLEQALQVATVGQNVGYFYEDDLRFPIVLRIGSPYRDSLAGIAATPVERPGGGVIALGSLGRMGKTEEVITIGRNNGRRFATVGVFLKDRDLQSFVEEAQQKIKAGLKLPPGFHLEWGGQFKNLSSARLRLAMILPLTLALIFLILYRTFGSIRQALLVLLCIPFALSGGIFALFVRGISFSISAEIGCIALAGIAVLNGTVLVSFFNHLRTEGHELHHEVERGALTRLRPVLMTALVAGIGFLPMAVNTGTGGEVQRPLATVVIMGLLTATLLTLLVLPSLYLWLEGDDRRPHRRSPGADTQ